MARTSKTLPWQQDQQQRRGCAGEDRLSALPDDLLMAILDRLDTRTALSTAVLAKRWARLPRRLRALDFMVSEILPPSFNESFTIPTANPYLNASINWYVRRRAMVSYTNAIQSLVNADAGAGAGGVEPRRVRKLQLEFFVPEDPVYVNDLIDAAVVRWAVQELKIVVRSMHSAAAGFAPPCHGAFESLRLDHIESRQRIRSLKLSGICTVERLRDFGQLTEIVLEDVLRPMLPESYENIFSSCPVLRSVQLRRCCTKGIDTDEIGISIMEVNAPASNVRELVVDDCTFYGVMLNALPLLERLACSGNPVTLAFQHVPRISHVDLSFAITNSDEYDDDYTMNDLMGGSPVMEELVARFTGAARWVAPGITGLTMFRALRRLLVADVPSSWDVSWPRLVLESAPSLQTFHMNIVTAVTVTAVADDTDDEDDDDDDEDDDDLLEMVRADITWSPSKFQHRRLEELVLVGSGKSATRWAYLVRYVMETCTALQRVMLVKNGWFDVKGLWGGWEVVVAPPPEGRAAGECPWTDEEKLDAMKEIKGENRSQQHGQVIFA